MSVPPEMLQRLKSAQSPALPGGGQPGPAGAPMNAPQEKDGKKEHARVQVHIAMNMLEQALSAFGAESKEGQVILKQLQALARAFGDTNASELVPAQLKEAVQNSPQVGGGNPQQQRLMQMMMARQMNPGGGGGRMPPMPMQ